MTSYLLAESGAILATETGQRILLEQSAVPHGGGGKRSRAPRARPQPKILRIGYDDLTPPTGDTPVVVDLDAMLQRLLALPAPYERPGPLQPLPTSDDELMLLLT